MSNEPDFTVSSGNVFADLGFEEPEAELARANLAYEIVQIIEHRGWTQEQAAAALGLDQPKVSAIVRGRLGGFSIERLMRLLTRLDWDVRITVAPVSGPERKASIRVLLPEGRPGPDREQGHGRALIDPVSASVGG